MVKRVGHGDLVQTIRGAAKRAIRDLDAKGKPLSKIWSDALEKEPLKALDTMAKFLPKEMLVETNEGDMLVDVLRRLNDRAAADNRLRSGDGPVETEPTDLH